MEKQTRRVQGFVNPDIVPVDQDQWDRLKEDIDAIHPVRESNANGKWGIIGFCGSLLISNIFYHFSASPSSNVAYVSLALCTGLLLTAWALGRTHRQSKNAQAQTILRCKRTVAAIEKRLRIERPELISTVLDQETSSELDNKRETDGKLEGGVMSDPSVKDILSKLNTRNKAR